MRAGQSVDQLTHDTYSLASLANRALQHVPDTKLPPNLFYIDRPRFIGEGRISGDDKQPADARERGNDLLDHAVCEIFLLWVTAHIRERQHCDRGFIG